MARETEVGDEVSGHLLEEEVAQTDNYVVYRSTKKRNDEITALVLPVDLENPVDLITTSHLEYRAIKAAVAEKVFGLKGISNLVKLWSDDRLNPNVADYSKKRVAE